MKSPLGTLPPLLMTALAAFGVTAAMVFRGPAAAAEPGPGGQTVDFGDGVVLTLAPGWSIQDHYPRSVNLLIPHESVGMDVSAGTAARPDITQEATMLIGQDIKARGLFDVQQQPQVQVQAVQGNNFQQALPINYTAKLSNDRGTFPVFGTWIQLFNPAAQRSAFLDYYTIDGEKYQAHLPDVMTMLASME